ncbi:malonyl CoA-acyl carrier protein transacylase [Gemmatirosa kalamazoonensis]|uniref:Malonyl CoA-acyl carrier protein transacylase n=1 Tax=Gemmatirosa kalamazoonensis TaxID=861299 RepID=W0RN00_9BACT|nr:ACP S-malonyltransferase [Gemmatirosa kalamazoonensis]AHG90808.1 malonyl CoA-acyl carrier protein transacylase [Gemmatirosa kalamazoonensis]
MDIVLLFPGQGSQTPGMGRDLAEAHAAAREVFAAVDDALGAPLSGLCFEGPAEELTLTHNAQPALLTHGAAVWATVRDALGPHVRAAAGHSLGEFTAYHAAGALDLGDAARLVRRRGELMFRSGEERPGAMAALLGDPTRPVEEICDEASRDAGLVVPANYNSPGQLVISGEVAGVERAMELAKAAGVRRAMRLNVSGAFHSPLMAPAQAGLREALDATDMRDADVPVYANVNAEPVTSAARARDLLAQQLVSPVRWIDVVRALAERHPDALFVEMGPGAVLSGLAKKIVPGIQTATCGTAAEVDALLERVGAPA